MSSNSRGLNLFAKEHYGLDSEYAQVDFALGDIVTTLIRTKAGQTIVITHDTNSPRAYSRDFMVQGTSGVVRKYPTAKIYIEGRGEAHQWQDLEVFRKEFEHPLWTSMEEKSRGAGHGGMDYIEDYRLIECLRNGEPTDMDVYDAAAWSAVSGLSEMSIAGGSKPVDCPDFTRGAWKNREPLGIIGA
jgi:hypothetical protein